MRIVIDARELRTSSGRYVERLLHYLQQIDQEHDYIILLAPQDFEGWQATNPHFTKVICPYKEFTFSEQIGMFKQIKNTAPDLVHFTFVQQPVLYRRPAVTTMHDLTTARFRNPTKQWLVFTIKQQIYVWLNKYVARRSAALITPSKFVMKDVMQFAGLTAEKFTVTYEAADAISTPPTPLSARNLQNTKFIMYVGRPQPHKNLWRLIEAFALLRQKYPGLQLVLAGKKDTAYQQIADRATAANLREGVVFAGFVNEGELRWLYEHCAAYVFPSLSEGFGLPGLEAMQHGAPVVSSNATCLPEIYGDAALYFNPLSVEDMMTKISNVLEDTALRDKLIAAGRIRAHTYSWKRLAEQTLAVYNATLNK